jgi:hypothetical protein
MNVDALLLQKFSYQLERRLRSVQSHEQATVAADPRKSSFDEPAFRGSSIGRFTMRNRHRGGLESTANMLNEKVMTKGADQGRRPAESGLDFPP